jgi:hypothetical protein
MDFLKVAEKADEEAKTGIVVDEQTSASAELFEDEVEGLEDM